MIRHLSVSLIALSLAACGGSKDAPKDNAAKAAPTAAATSDDASAAVTPAATPDRTSSIIYRDADPELLALYKRLHAAPELSLQGSKVLRHAGQRAGKPWL